MLLRSTRPREAGADTSGFADYLDGEGSRERTSIQRAAEESGVFGVPTFFVGDEMFFGKERLGQVEEAIQAMATEGATS